MKGLAFFAIVIVIAPIGLFYPFYGMMYYNWFALMKPEWLFYGFPHSIPVAMIVAICTFLGWLLSKERKVPPFDATTWLVLALCIWMGITTLFALDRSLAWTKYNDMIKVQLFALIFYAMLTSPERVKIALWVLGLSIALFGAKGGIKSIITGGSYRIYGPDHSIINDNNDFGVALATFIPLLFVLRGTCEKVWQRHAMMGLIVLNILAELFTYSRGGLLALCGMGCVFWWRSRSKFLSAILIAIGVFAFLQFAPARFFDRAKTIETYEQDGSAQSRLYMWQLTWVMAKDRPVTGAGFWWLKNNGNANRYAFSAGMPPVPKFLGAAHSIYFENLGDHGFVGLFLFLALIAATLRNAVWLAKQRLAEHGMAWAEHLGRVVPASLVGFLVGGAFATVSTFEGYYQLFIIVAATRALASKVVAKTRVVKPKKRIGVPLPASAGAPAAVRQSLARDQKQLARQITRP